MARCVYGISKANLETTTLEVSRTALRLKSKSGKVQEKADLEGNPGDVQQVAGHIKALQARVLMDPFKQIEEKVVAFAGGEIESIRIKDATRNLLVILGLKASSFLEMARAHDDCGRIDDKDLVKILTGDEEIRIGSRDRLVGFSQSSAVYRLAHNLRIKYGLPVNLLDYDGATALLKNSAACHRLTKLGIPIVLTLVQKIENVLGRDTLVARAIDCRTQSWISCDQLEVRDSAGLVLAAQIGFTGRYQVL